MINEVDQESPNSAHKIMEDPGTMVMLTNAIKLAFRTMPLSRRYGLNVTDHLTDSVQDVLVHLWDYNPILPDNKSDLEKEIRTIVSQYIITKYTKRQHPESYRIHKRIEYLARKPGTKIICEDGLYSISDYEGKLDSKQKTGENIGELLHRVERGVPVVPRDRKVIGRHGSDGESGQIIISNPALEKLISDVLRCVEVPIPLNWLSSLVLSRVSIMDPIRGELPDGDEVINRRVIVSRAREEIHQAVASKDAQKIATDVVEKIYPNNGKSFRKNIEAILAYFDYEDGRGLTNIDIADNIGVSDSSVSDYVKKFTTRLKEILNEDRFRMTPDFFTQHFHPALMRELRKRLEAMPLQ